MCGDIVVGCGVLVRRGVMLAGGTGFLVDGRLVGVGLSPTGSVLAGIIVVAAHITAILVGGMLVSLVSKSGVASWWWLIVVGVLIYISLVTHLILPVF